MQKLNEEIKTKQFKQIYLLYGEEDYLRNQYKDRLKKALLGDGDTMNYHYFEGKDVSVGEVIDLAETMPFLAKRRVIVLENTTLFKRGGEALAEYAASPSETASLIFVEKEIDQRSKLYKAVNKHGRVVEFRAQDESVLKRWILGTLKKENKNITGRDLEYFLEKTGQDMQNISKELEKLLCYCMGRDVITKQDIDEICSRQINNQIFGMIDAIAEKRGQKAMDLYYDLLALKVEPMWILVQLGRQFARLMQVKELKSKGHDNKSIGTIVGLKPFAVKKCVSQAARFPASVIKQVVEDCVGTDEAIKTGKINQKIGVELLLIRYSA